MMGDICLALRAYLQSIKFSLNFSAYEVWNDIETSNLLRQDFLPAIIITFLGEEPQNGDMGGTGTWHYHLRIRIIVNYVDNLAARFDKAFGIYSLTEQIKNALVQNKNLGILQVRGLLIERIQDIPVLTGTSLIGHVVARDLYINYYTLVRWDGPENNQPDFVLEDDIKFN